MEFDDIFGYDRVARTSRVLVLASRRNGLARSSLPFALTPFLFALQGAEL